MNHDEAVGTGATERYLLHELPDSERDAFEEHYFACAVCANDLHAASALIESLPAYTEPAVIRHPAAWHSNVLAPYAIAASVIMALMLGWMYFGMVRPRQDELEAGRRPHLLTYVRLESNRGENPTLAESSSKPFGLQLPIPPDGSPMYTCHIIDSRRVTRYSLTVPASLTQDYVGIEVPAGALAPGHYTLRVDGKRPKIAEFKFIVNVP